MRPPRRRRLPAESPAGTGRCRVELEELCAVRLGILAHHDPASVVGGAHEPARDDLSGGDVDVARRRAVRAAHVRGSPPRLIRLCDRVAAARHDVADRLRVRESPFSRSPSSSRANDEGLNPPPAVKEKSCAAFGSESCTTTMKPRLWLTNVQWTCSPSSTSMFETGEPSSRWPTSGPSRTGPARPPSSRSQA